MCQLCPTERRRFLKSSLLTLGAGLTGVTAASTALAASPAPRNIAPTDALERLLAGNARYVAGQPTQRDFSVDRAARAAGQRPFAAVLACADSRVAPEILFDQGLGDLFVVRVAGNIVESDGLASLEFAVGVLGVSVILVMGHSHCGAVESAIAVAQDGLQLPGSLPGLIQPILPAVAVAESPGPGVEPLDAVIAANVKLGVNKLKNSEAILRPAWLRNELQIAGGVYELASGEVHLV